MSTTEFTLPEWARNEEGNILFQRAVARGAIASTLLYKTSAESYLAERAGNFTHKNDFKHQLNSYMTYDTYIIIKIMTIKICCYFFFISSLCCDVHTDGNIE